jgi:hypothetical protein
VVDRGAAGYRLGVSFSHRRALRRGLDPRAAFRRVLDLGLDPVRLSVYWDDVERDGAAEVGWQLDQAEAAGRRVVLTVGMKGQGWPEFYLPESVTPVVGRRGEIAPADTPAGRELRARTLELVAATVERHRERASIELWQVENEPLNPSGPNRWWIGPDLVAEEIAAVHRVDPTRPVCVNAFAHFNLRVDVHSSRFGLLRLTGIGRTRPEAEALSLLGEGDVLGLDVYRRIGHMLGSLKLLARAFRWDTEAGRWQATARESGRRAWVIEAQAEPWQPWPDTPGNPVSCAPEDLPVIVERLQAVGFDTILLWGAEHWIAEEEAGHPEWVAAVEALRPVSPA